VLIVSLVIMQKYVFYRYTIRVQMAALILV